jgi:hypothetical protein
MMTSGRHLLKLAERVIRSLLRAFLSCQIVVNLSLIKCKWPERVTYPPLLRQHTYRNGVSSFRFTSDKLGTDCLFRMDLPLTTKGGYRKGRSG